MVVLYVCWFIPLKAYGAQKLLLELEQRKLPFRSQVAIVSKYAQMSHVRSRAHPYPPQKACEIQ